MNFVVVTAENSKKGAERAIAEKSDVILMNSIMPEMDGWEATRFIAFKLRNQIHSDTRDHSTVRALSS